MISEFIEAGREIRDEICALSDAIYEKPELGHEEYESSRLHREILEKHGFRVEMPYMGLKTGYRAEYRSAKPGPAICFMAEYDALPGVGHGCGHNMLGSTSVAAGIILSRFVDEAGGCAVVLGTPAEETSGAKVMYAEKGAFKDIAAAMVSHPGEGVHNRSGRSLAMTAIEFVFTGKPSHAASAPEKGVNALDAATLTLVSIGLLRQQTREDARIHGIITEGGVAPNVIPERCVMQFYVRAGDKRYLALLLEKVKNCARGAAVSTECSLEMKSFEESYDDLLTNSVLSDMMTESLYAMGVKEVEEPRKSYGSLDAGNVSYVCPTIHPYFPITSGDGPAPHTEAFGACTLSDYAKDNMMTTAQAMALTGYRIITEPDMLRKMREEFERETGA